MGAPASPLQTEFNFTLPRGYVDAQGKVHRDGCMRLATAMDEIAPMRDPRVRDNQAYLTVLILSRVVTRLGDIVEVSTNTIEKLFTSDLAYLQDLYRRINTDGVNQTNVACPNCNHVFAVQAAPGGNPSGE
ncbi:MAG: hypothetical protein HY782_06675 [Chloroflexi bacterium]|nr:hypothetical protein [Chloroflexota bacterium]